MALIKPFKGIRYNKKYSKEMDNLTAPPYDVISEEEQIELHNIHPYNIVRLEYGLTYHTDNELNNRYTRAANYLDSWLKNGVLVQDDNPSIYIYQQAFSIDGKQIIRTGFISLVKIEEFSKGIILPHEYTLSKPKADRLDLMRACKANFSQIFSLYNDTNYKISSILNEFTKQQPDIEFKDRSNIINRLWPVSDKQTIDSIQQAFVNKQLFIADGNHRYETALQFRDEMRSITGLDDGKQPFDYVMMMMVAMEDPGLVILPTHRIVSNIENVNRNELLNEMKEYFNITPIDKSFIMDAIRQHESDEMPYFIYYDGENCNALQLKNWIYAQKSLLNKPEAYWKLDISILHALIISKMLGISAEDAAQQRYISYTRDIKDALKAVDSGQAKFAFLVRPTKVEQVKAVALAGEKMPQKSTYFYPKLLTGLVIYKF